MTAPHYADVAAKLLRPRLEAEPPGPAPGVRQDAIAALQRAIADKARADVRSRRLRLAAGGLAAAAALALAVGGAAHPWSARTVPPSAAATAPVSDTPQGVTVVAHPSGNGAAVVASSGAPPAALGDGRELGAGSRVIADRSGRALLSFSTGTTMMVEEGGDLTVVERGSEQRFNLTSGKVHANVAKLHEGQRFLIETTDAEVEVRGTSFDVAVVDPQQGCGGGTHTRVAVTEGVVVVRSAGTEDRVAAGEQWPRDCVTVPDTARKAKASSKAPAAVAPVTPATRAPSNVPSSSALAAQNDLFEQGVAAMRHGDAALAVTTFDRFLASYPESPLAESAAALRMRALRSVDPARAREAARKYLSAYPAGFARSEAGALVAEGP